MAVEVAQNRVVAVVTEERVSTALLDIESVAVVTETVTTVVEMGVSGPQGPPGEKGDPGDQGPTGAAGIFKEDITAQIDGSNSSFTLSNQFVAGTTVVYLNGLMQDDPGDYAETSATSLEFVEAPLMGDRLVVVYGIGG